MFFPSLFLKLCLFLSCGILAGYFLPSGDAVQACAAACACLLLLPLLHVLHCRAAFGVSCLLFLFCAGFTAAVVESDLPCDHAVRWRQESSSGNVLYAGCVCAEPAGRERSVKCMVRLMAVGADGRLLTDAVNEKVLVYLPKDSSALALRQGDLLVWRSPLSVVDFSRDGFDYAAYLRKYGVFRNAFVRSGEWRRAAAGCLPFWRQGPADLRYLLLERLRRCRLKPLNHDVVAALTLGYREGLDDDVKERYAAAGAMHVLAVSGLHVGVLYTLCCALLAPLRRRPKGHLAATLVSLLFLWVVALITGFSPSVTRAVTMFSFVAAGVEMRRITVIWNSVFMSAFLLLCYRALWLLEPGFQLSYGAVAAIVALSPHLLPLWTPRSRAALRVWQLTCVSLSAQMGILPLSLYYFHQFPTYFLCSNLIVIPCATVILYLTVCLMPFAFAGWPSWCAGRLLDTVAAVLNTSVSCIERLPYAVIQPVPFSGTDLCFAFGLVLCAGLSVRRRSVPWAAAVLLVCTLWNLCAFVIGNSG